MKQVLYKIFSFIRSIFLSLGIHLHVGICTEGDSNDKGNMQVSHEEDTERKA